MKKIKYCSDCKKVIDERTQYWIGTGKANYLCTECVSGGKRV